MGARVQARRRRAGGDSGLVRAGAGSMRAEPNGHVWLFTALAIVWAADSGAVFRRPPFRRSASWRRAMSPNKTDRRPGRRRAWPASWSALAGRLARRRELARSCRLVALVALRCDAVLGGRRPVREPAQAPRRREGFRQPDPGPRRHPRSHRWRARRPAGIRAGQGHVWFLTTAGGLNRSAAATWQVTGLPASPRRRSPRRHRFHRRVRAGRDRAPSRSPARQRARGRQQGRSADRAVPRASPAARGDRRRQPASKPCATACAKRASPRRPTPATTPSKRSPRANTATPSSPRSSVRPACPRRWRPRAPASACCSPTRNRWSSPANC